MGLDIEGEVVALSQDDASGPVYAATLESSAGLFQRVNGSWILLGAGHTDYDGLYNTPIEPSKVSDFLAGFDLGGMTVPEADLFSTEPDRLGPDEISFALGQPINLTRITEIQERETHSLWGDPSGGGSRWSKFLGECWNALRCDDWSKLSFDPAKYSALARTTKKQDSVFAVFTALSDMLTFGGRWANPVDVIYSYKQEGPSESNIPSEAFWKFWEPLISEYLLWANGWGLIHEFSFEQNLDPAILGNMMELVFPNSELIAGGTDSLHISSHSLVPLRPESYSGEPSRVEVSGATPYFHLTCDSYAAWGHFLLTQPTNRTLLVRIDVKIAQGSPEHFTLGHFIVSSNEGTPHERSQFPYNVTFVSDKKAYEWYLQIAKPEIWIGKD